ncbi:universal stress protein [Haladaptatus sp. DJG-WS-42]|uniref:universal stress protein n=1 Tax=Haladaptatus sp. DJG-WS-42 TaxID=3120516 RepID=UPI0030CAECD3
MRVLVPIDGSDCSFAALDYALDLYNMGGVTLHVIHITDYETDASEELLKKATDRLSAAGIDAEPELVTSLGLDSPKASVKIGEHIVSLLEADDYDQVVIGRHGERGRLEDFLLGSTSETIVKHAPVPVTVIPA